MSEIQIINRILEKRPPLKTTIFLEDLKQKVEKYGALIGGQRMTLAAIANDFGIKMTTESHTAHSSDKSITVTAPGTVTRETVVKEAPPLRLVEIKGSCGDCVDGLVHTETIERKYHYVFKCTCKIGRLLQENYPLWSSSLNSTYQIQKLTM